MWVRGDAQCAPLTADFVPDERGGAFSENGTTRGHALLACEHFEHAPSHGVTVFACDPGRKDWNACVGPLIDHRPRGALWVLASDKVQHVPIEGYPTDKDFHPLGIALWDLGDALRVFATNHGETASSVEVIDLHQSPSGWTGSFVRTVSHPVGTHAVNSLVALGPSAFLVTNTHVALLRPPPLEHIRAMLSSVYGAALARFARVLAQQSLAKVLNQVDMVLGLGYVAHVAFDQEVTANVLVRRLMFPNGIALTPSRRAMVVSSTVYPGMLVFPIEPNADWSTLELSERTTVHVPFFVDNISLARRKHAPQDDPIEGHMVVVAGHPSLRDMEKMKHDVTGATTPAPSWAVEVYYVGDGDASDDAPVRTDSVGVVTPGWCVRTLLQTNGRGTEHIKVPAATTAAWVDGRLLVATLFNTAPVVCTGITH
ncbi:hypothetical protein MCUN1_001051 [Malassezia cuniculi]|uniref:Uncharacterized protein n=1 Tax=Malassezia cuniculi TaxID=948313 RepID=A0AAF0J673_9BASI|nr:hypothetical protein MCUN1_001051 [Malassezia cuniculi]